MWPTAIGADDELDANGANNYDNYEQDNNDANNTAGWCCLLRAENFT